MTPAARTLHNRAKAADRAALIAPTPALSRELRRRARDLRLRALMAAYHLESEPTA